MVADERRFCPPGSPLSTRSVYGDGVPGGTAIVSMSTLGGPVVRVYRLGPKMLAVQGSTQLGLLLLAVTVCDVSSGPFRNQDRFAPPKPTENAVLGYAGVRPGWNV